jgi:PAS domain S-box-containing protein
VPGTWRGHEVDGQPLGGDGYATYRLRVLVDPATLPEASLAIRVPVLINTAHRLYVDGQLLGSAGQVGRTAATMTPQYQPYVVAFTPAGKQVEILLQISNFYHYQGGILIQPLVLGPQAELYLLAEQQLGRDLFLIGSIFIMGLYHLGLFALRRREPAPLYFGLFCLSITGITLLLWQPQIFAYFISQDWAVLVRSLCLLAVCSIVGFALFVHTLFPQEASSVVLRLIFGVGILFAGLGLLASTAVVTALLLPMALYLALVSLYGLGIVLLAVTRKRTGAVIFLLGFIPLVVSNINDALYFSGLLQTQQLVAVGIFIFIFAQAYLLSVRFAAAFARTEALSEELRRSEEKYRAIFEDSKDVIFITTVDGQIEEMNAACFAVLGYTSAEALAMNALDFYADPAERARFQAAIAQTGAVTDFSLALRHKHGHELESQLSATVRRDEAGQVIGYQGIIHDMTAYQQAEAHRQRLLALQDLNQSLEERVELRTAALSEATTALQAEIEQRQMHQVEKDRLLSLAQQQSDHLRAMSNWLVENQQHQRQESSTGLDEEFEQKIGAIRQNLSILQGAAVLEHDPHLTTYIVDTMRLLAEMEIYIEQVTAPPEDAIDPSDPLANNPLLQLSARERQVLKLMAEGKSNPEIADALTIRLNTVHTYLKRIRLKLDIQDNPGLIAFARANGLVE